MREDLRGFARLIAQKRDFRKLWISHMISLIGDWLSYIAVAVISVEQGDSALAVGMVLFVHSLPTALMSPIAGPLADRLDRRWLIMGGYLGAALLTVGMWGAAQQEAVWLLQAVLFLRVCLSGVAMTARAASIPALVGREDLRLANALLGLTWSVMFSVGLALGGFATEYLSPSGAILLDAMTFVAAALVASTLPSLKPQVDTEGTPTVGFADMKRAWRYVAARPQLMANVLAKTPPIVFNGGAWVTLNLVAGQRLSTLSLAVAIGAMQCVRAVGTGIGPLMPVHILPRDPRVGSLVAFLGMALFIGVDAVWVSVIALALWGVGQGHNWVISTAEIQAATPDHLLGRVTAIDLCLLSLGGALAAVCAGFVSDTLSDPAAGAWITFGIAALGWLYCVRLSTSLRTS